MFAYILQVYNCLQPLMVCLSYKGTFDLLDSIAKDYDAEVKVWSDNLKTHFLTVRKQIVDCWYQQFEDCVHA